MVKFDLHYLHTASDFSLYHIPDSLSYVSVDLGVYLQHLVYSVLPIAYAQEVDIDLTTVDPSLTKLQ